jgi:SAM-dependent methyltransferase
VASFETVADEYDAARPSYPDGVYEALGDLRGLLVLDVGAGTGIASRQLRSRGASVIALDRGREVLGRALVHTPTLPVVVADGVKLPVAAHCVDLVCCAQAWHWLDPASRVVEAHRVLRPGGRWAGWWSHARADDQDWFDAYWTLIERYCTGTGRDQRDTDWGATVAAAGLLDVGERVVVRWVREISVDAWMVDQVSHSYVIALDHVHRGELVRALRAILDEQFPDGAMTVPYQTWLWIATKSDVAEGRP